MPALNLELAHDNLVHAHVHGEPHRIHHFMSKVDGPQVIARQELPCLNRRLDRAIKGMLYRRRELCEVVFKDEAEGFGQELLHISALRFTPFHEIIQVSQVIQGAVRPHCSLLSTACQVVLN